METTTTTTTTTTMSSATATMPLPLAQSNTNGKTLGTPQQARAIKPSEYKAAAHALAEAFADDETARYFLDTPDLAHWSEQQKWDLHVSIFEYLTYLHCICGVVTTAGDDYGCVALWLPPGRNADSLVAQLRAGAFRLYYKLSREGRTRFFREFAPLLYETKLEVLGAKHDADSYYLVYIGTRPGSRGLGLARRCMEWGMDRADQEGRLCYLESSSCVNLKIYGRMGFQARKTISLIRAIESEKLENGDQNTARDGEVVLDIMVREPVPRETPQLK